MAKHTKQTNKSNKMLKVLSITIGSIIVVIAGVYLAINLTYPGKTPYESFHTTQSSIKPSSTTKESKSVESTTEESKTTESTTEESAKLQGKDVTTREDSTTESSNLAEYKDDELSTYSVVYADSSYIVSENGKGQYFVTSATGEDVLRSARVQEWVFLLKEMGVQDLGTIDQSKMNDMVTGLSVNVSEPFKPSADPVYIYTDNTPAAYTLK